MLAGRILIALSSDCPQRREKEALEVDKGLIAEEEPNSICTNVMKELKLDQMSGAIIQAWTNQHIENIQYCHSIHSFIHVGQVLVAFHVVNPNLYFLNFG